MNERWCNTHLSARCPFHDGGTRFSCHLASSRYRKCVELPRQPLNVCSVIGGRTLLVVGDSLGQQLYDTLRCHACGPDCVPPAVPVVTQNKSEGWSPVALRKSCTTFSTCRICILRAFEVHSHYAMDVNYSVVLSDISEAFVDPVVVFNEGLWLAANGNHNAAEVLRKAVARAHNLAGAWAQYRSSRTKRDICVLWRETSPQDFATPTGAYDASSRGWLRTWYNKAPCKSHANQTVSPWEPVHDVLSQGSIPVVRVWNASRRYYDQHLEMNTVYMQRKHASDCTHYCTPGPVDLWVELVLNAILIHCTRPRQGL